MSSGIAEGHGAVAFHACHPMVISFLHYQHAPDFRMQVKPQLLGHLWGRVCIILHTTSEKICKSYRPREGHKIILSSTAG